MKAFSLLLMGVLVSTLVFANETVEPKESVSAVAVTNCSGSSVVKVFYKAEQAGTVKVSIFSQDHSLVFTETMKRVSGFLRPYNFSELSAGKYTIQIEDSNGKKTETVDYVAGKIEKLISIVKLAEEGKYLLSVYSEASDRINVKIYNDANQLIHSQEKRIDRSFAEVLNIKDINQFTIEVSDSHGVLKSVRN